MKESECALILLLTLCFGISAIPLVRAAEDYWTTLEPMPTPRGYMRVAVTNGRIYAMGTSHNGTNEEYDPDTDSWKTKTSIPDPKSMFAIAACEGKIYCIGGEPVGFLGASDANKVYDPGTDSWETKAAMPTERYGLQAQVVNKKIYLIGGRILLGYEKGSEELNVTEVYDPASDTWSTAASMPNIGCYASAVVDGKIFVIGSTTQIYDPQTNTWSTATSPPKELILEVNGYAATAVSTTGIMAPKRIYVYDGSTLQIYDPQMDNWSYGPAPPTIRQGLGIAVVNDLLYFIGGSTGNSPFEVYIEYATNERYTPTDYIPEFPSWIVLPMSVLITTAVIVSKNRLRKHNQSEKQKENH